jgi:hypothetical protein
MEVVEHVSDNKQAKLRVQDITKVEYFILYHASAAGWTALGDKLTRQQAACTGFSLATQAKLKVQDIGDYSKVEDAMVCYVMAAACPLATDSLWVGSSL